MLEKKPIVELLSTVVEIITETPTTKTLFFEDGGLDFYPGQYVMIEVPYPKTGEVLKRAYSIANPPTQKDHLSITVKRTPNGKASYILTEHTRVGDKFKVKGPYGKFVWLPGMSTRIVLVAAGSGIVPLMCMLRYIVDANLHNVKATLLYSNTSYEEVIYREELKSMEKHSNIKIVHTLTRSVPEGWKGYTGRINPDMILKEVDDIPANLYYVCGPPKFVDDISVMLTELGADREQIKKEKYD